MENFNDSKVPIKVQKRSGFDKSFHNLLSARVGELIPVLFDELIPNTTINIKQAISLSMPPLASDTYMKVDLKFEAFFVPHRLLYGGFEDWFTDSDVNELDYNGSLRRYKPFMPIINIDMASIIDDAGGESVNQVFGPGTLCDYLGFKNYIEGGQDYSLVRINPLPFIAYAKVWDSFYRSPLIQKSIFVDSVSNQSPASEKYWPSALHKMTLNNLNYGFFIIDTINSFPKFIDNSTLFSIRKRNFGFDYFTNAWPSAQLGEEAKVTVDSNSTFTISQLRSMNAIQLFRERNNIAGTRLVDVVKTRYGADLSNGVAQMPLFLGSCTYDVYNKTVDVTGNNPSTEGASFNWAAGAQLGRAYAVGNDTIVDNFTANEPGYLIVLASLVPRVSYGSGINRYFTRYIAGAGSIGDFANPILQPVGNQPIYTYELNSRAPIVNPTVFGYTDRFADWMIKSDEVHGLFGPGQSLEYMALRRDFTNVSDGPFIGSDFLQISPYYMDGVTTVNGAVSRYGYWLQVAFDYKSVMPLAQYSIPSLQDPAYEHGDTIMIHRGGFRL